MQTPRDAVHSLANATAVLSATLGRAAAGLRRCDEGSLSALIVEKSEDDGMGELFGAVAVLLGRRQLTDGAEWWNVFHKQNQKPLLDQLKDLDVAKMAVSKIRKARVLLSRAKLAQPLLAHSLPPTLETLDRARSDGEFSKDEPARERSSSLQSASKEGKDVASGLLQWVASVIDYHDFALASAPRAGALALNRMELSVREKRLEYTESDEYDFYGAESVDLCASRGRFVTPLQTPAGVELLKWWRESGMDTIDSINQPGVRAALSSLLAEARLVLEDEMRRAQPCGELLQTRLAQLQYNYKQAYKSVLRTVKTDSSFEAFRSRAASMQLECRKNGSASCRQSDTDIVAVFVKATKVRPRFEAVISHICDELLSNGDSVEYIKPTLKNLVRALEKTGMVPEPVNLEGAPVDAIDDALGAVVVATDSPVRWDASRTIDIVRGALKFNSMATMLVALEYLATTPGLAVRRVKDRFSSPTAGGWADCLVNLEFVDDDELRGHVCELQFVHKTLYFVRDRMGAHHSYDVFRSAAELLEASGAVPNVPAEEGDEASELPAVLAPGTLDVSAFAKAVSAAVLAAIEPRLGALDARFSQFESRLESRVSRLERHFKAVEIQLGACLPPKAAEALQTSACRPLKATEALQASPPAGRPVPPKPRPASPVPPKPRPPPRPAENSKS